MKDIKEGYIVFKMSEKWDGTIAWKVAINKMFHSRAVAKYELRKLEDIGNPAYKIEKIITFI